MVYRSFKSDSNQRLFLKKTNMFIIIFLGYVIHLQGLILKSQYSVWVIKEKEKHS